MILGGVLASLSGLKPVKSQFFKCAVLNPALVFLSGMCQKLATLKVPLPGNQQQRHCHNQPKSAEIDCFLACGELVGNRRETRPLSR